MGPQHQTASPDGHSPQVVARIGATESPSSAHHPEASIEAQGLHLKLRVCKAPWQCPQLSYYSRTSGVPKVRAAASGPVLLPGHVNVPCVSCQEMSGVPLRGLDEAQGAGRSSAASGESAATTRSPPIVRSLGPFLSPSRLNLLRWRGLCSQHRPAAKSQEGHSAEARRTCSRRRCRGRSAHCPREG